MPEGDTIHRTATTLRKVLAGQRVVEGRIHPSDGSDIVRLSDVAVDAVTSRGKHLLVFFADDRVLHTHMQMHGSWHVYRPGEEWRRAEHRATAVLRTADFVAVCFDAPIVRVGPARKIERDRMLTELGPDLIADECDLDTAFARLREHPRVAIGEALMDQRIAAGIGNVFKSEILFLARCSPFARVDELTDDELRELLALARRLLRDNRASYPRVTRGPRRGEHVWVYKRSGAPCPECTTTIRMRRQGVHGRSTYFCPRCQDRRRHNGTDGADDV